MKNKTIKSNSNALKLTAISAGLVGLAGTTYLLLGPNGKKNQKQTKAWALKMKKDVMKKLEKIPNITESIYNEIIDSISTKYENGKKIESSEIKNLTHDLKKHWKTISLETMASKNDVKKVAKKITK